MSKYKNAKEMLESELPRSVTSHLYPIFNRGIAAYNSILNMEGGTFQSVFLHNIKGPLLNYMIFRQFEPDMLNDTFPFTPFPQKVNSFNYSALNLLHNNVKINVGKSLNSDLPNRSKYRRTACEVNRFPDDDLFYGTSGQYDQLFENNEPYYVFLTFNLKGTELDFVNLVVPNWNMTKCLAQVELKKELRLYIPSEEEKKTDEKVVTSLKTEFMKLPIKGEAIE
ncbi:MAG: hypothetical protein APF84_13220 [Gracilibacter sp. BRH_c7a]|nr:MAG: hypothetical protein APF84_13220 [Gracilibacter sp. BRH_c7a]